LTGLESSSAATDELEIFNTTKVNLRREPVINRPSSNQWDNADVNVGFSSNGTKKRLRSEI
jgi:hypothetical protein|tara:strand:+ start:416 stop:598 length:183 start_codon:yes stop_codon:yes gene_type:complete